MTSPTAWQPAPEDDLDVPAVSPAAAGAWTPPPGRLGGAEVDPFAGMRRPEPQADGPAAAARAEGEPPRGRLARAWAALTSEERATWGSVSRVVGVRVILRQLVGAVVGVVLIGVAGFLLGFHRPIGFLPLVVGVALVLVGLRRTSRFLDQLPR